MPSVELSRYIKLVNLEMVKLYGITFEELGLGGPDNLEIEPWLSEDHKAKVTPKEFALQYGEKYDLHLKSEWGLS